MWVGDGGGWGRGAGGGEEEEGEVEGDRGFEEPNLKISASIYINVFYHVSHVSRQRYIGVLEIHYHTHARTHARTHTLTHTQQQQQTPTKTTKQTNKQKHHNIQLARYINSQNTTTYN